MIHFLNNTFGKLSEQDEVSDEICASFGIEKITIFLREKYGKDVTKLKSNDAST